MTPRAGGNLRRRLINRVLTVKRKQAVKGRPAEFSTRGLRARPKDARIQFVVDWLLRHGLNRDLRADEIARAVNLSASRLRHLFKHETGMPLTRALKLIRLQKAKDMLENSFLEVKEVMAAVGCTDMSHFVRDYKTMWGETPSQTRRFSPKGQVRRPDLGTQSPDLR
jgi:transcriptional regulator GlxA family with amidase domain